MCALPTLYILAPFETQSRRAPDVPTTIAKDPCHLHHLPRLPFTTNPHPHRPCYHLSPHHFRLCYLQCDDRRERTPPAAGGGVPLQGKPYRRQR